MDLLAARAGETNGEHDLGSVSSGLLDQGEEKGKIGPLAAIKSPTRSGPRWRSRRATLTSPSSRRPPPGSRSRRRIGDHRHPGNEGVSGSGRRPTVIRRVSINPGGIRHHRGARQPPRVLLTPATSSLGQNLAPPSRYMSPSPPCFRRSRRWPRGAGRRRAFQSRRRHRRRPRTPGTW